jgi:hypothetical protein
MFALLEQSSPNLQRRLKMPQLLKLVFTAAALSLLATPVNATVYTPVTNYIPSLTVPTDGLLGSFFVTNPGGFPNQSLAGVEAFLESNSATMFNGLTTNLTKGLRVNDCGSSDAFNCLTPRHATSNLLGNVFDIRIGAGNFIFVYDKLISNFAISYATGGLSFITNRLISCGGNNLPACGTALGNIRVFTNSAVLDNTPDVPLPAGAWLLVSGLTGMGWLGRNRKEKG